MVIAIDGPSGSGKTSSAKMLSEQLGFYYCDSGSLYRAVTYFLIENCVDLNNDVDDTNILKYPLLIILLIRIRYILIILMLHLN